MSRRFLSSAVILAALSTVSCTRLYENRHPVCDVRAPTILMAESVKTATKVPCVRVLPAGWAFQSFDAQDGQATFALDAQNGGAPFVDRDVPALEVTLRPSCSPSGDDVSSNVPGTRLSRDVRSTDPYAAHWTYRFRGGCAVLAFSFASGAPVDELLRQVRTGLSFISRSRIDETLRRRGGTGLGPATA